MDTGLVLKGVEEVKAGKVSLATMVKIAIQAETLAAQIMAITTCVKDGSIYQLPVNGCKDTRDYAMLSYVLSTLADTGEEIMKAAKGAQSGTEEKNGADGHAQRFAELLTESQLKKVSYEDLGTFYINSASKAVPPAKENPKYAEFKEWCEKNGIMNPPSYSYPKLQTAAREMAEKGLLPDFIKLIPRQEVRLRSN